MFERTELLIGKENVLKLKKKNILVIGLGGVGGYVVESLVRSGIENITIVDYDTIALSNINRQIIATHKDMGRLKTEVWEERMKNINPNCSVSKKNLFLSEENIEELINGYDYVIDACDTITAKKEIMRVCIEKQIPFISSMGTGKRLDPTKLKIVDLKDTSYDPIAKILRKYRKDNFPKAKVKVLYSSEIPMDTESKEIPSMIFVPSVAGILIANYVVLELLR